MCNQITEKHEKESFQKYSFLLHHTKELQNHTMVELEGTSKGHLLVQKLHRRASWVLLAFLGGGWWFVSCIFFFFLVL